MQRVIGWLRFASCFLLVLITSAVGEAEVKSGIDALNEHLVGVWVGTNHDYMKGSPITSSVTIAIEKDKKPGQLYLAYTYVTGPKQNVDHYDVLLRIDPLKAMAFRDRKKIRKDRYVVEGLDKVLATGYGDFTFLGWTGDAQGRLAAYRADYHLSPDTLSYEVFTSTDGAPFVKTGDWALRRAAAAQ